MAVEALSPRPTNILRRPGIPAMQKHPSVRPATTEPHQQPQPQQQQPPQAAAAPHKNASGKSSSSSAQKPHAPPPPPIVREPVEGGEEYVTGKFLGKGGFAICYEGRLVRNSKVFALKVVKSEMNQRKMAEKFRTELQIHSKMQHPNIVGFFRAFAFEKSTFVVLELCSNGSIMDMVKKRKALTLPEVRRFMVQLCGAVKYMHRRCVAHRDLKMGNLFLDKDMNIKVGDFGLAACILSEKDEKRRRTLCGTPNYIAPEVLDKSKGGHNQKVDIWSIGVIFFAMLTGIPPFQSKTQEEIYRKVKTLTYGWPKEGDCLNDIPEEAKDVVKRCLNLDEDERPEPDDIVDHPFFDMYPGCIPRQFDTSILTSPPAWIKNQAPRGDRMITGYSLNNDANYRDKLQGGQSFEDSYYICKDLFYSECGVGRTPSGYLRRSVGTRPTRSVYAECVTEEGYGLQPIIPLPDDRVYTPFLEDDDDWAATGADGTAVAAAVADGIARPARNGSKLQAVNVARTQNALAAAQTRLKENKPQSHAAVMRQQSLPHRPATRERRVPTGGETEHLLAKAPVPAPAPPQPQPQPQRSNHLLAEPPVRTRSSNTVSAAPAGSPPRKSAASRDYADPALHKYPSAPALEKERKHRDLERRLRDRSPTGRSPIDDIGGMDRLLREPPHRPRPTRTGTGALDNYLPSGRVPEDRHPAVSRHPAPPPSKSGVTVTTSAATTASAKSKSTIGVNPLIHPNEPAEVMPGTTATEVMRELGRYLVSLSSFDDAARTAEILKARRRQKRERLQPHPYVVKWVDYTNRYGIGYVLDDGSVGCVFKAEHGSPASGVVVRHGEKHIRRKARAKKDRNPTGKYFDAHQLVPRDGEDVEFYESMGPGSQYPGGLKRVLVPPTAFEVKTQGGSTAVRVRTNLGAEATKCETEKVKRVKLVDQFGKYMIGSLGSGGDEEDAEEDTASSTQYVKFYQRLGNVGVWGFGDGAFQFNFPDHTKLVLSHAKHDPKTPADPLSCQIDFYHLSASAARYLAAKGKMHPSGFETRAVACDDISTYFAAMQKGSSASSTTASSSSSSSKLHDVLHANAFPEKLAFIKQVLESWVRSRRLGAPVMPTSDTRYARRNSTTGEVFWEGAQEKTWAGPSGSKFVWVTVGAHGGDGEYLAVTFKRDPESGDIQCSGAESLKELGQRLAKLTI